MAESFATGMVGKLVLNHEHIAENRAKPRSLVTALNPGIAL